MLIYTYVCKKYGEKFDLLIGIISEKVELKCKKCGGKNIKKIFDSFNTGSLKGKLNSLEGTCSTGTCNL